MVRKEKIWKNRILAEIDQCQNQLINPYEPWCTDIINKITDSNDLGKLEILGKIVRRHSDQVNKWKMAEVWTRGQDQAEISGTLFHYFYHEKTQESWLQDLQLLLEFCDPKTLQLETQDNYGNDMIQIFAWAGRPDILNCLETRTNILSQNLKTMSTPLHVARDTKTLQFFLNDLKALEENFGYELTQKYLNVRDLISGGTALHNWAERGDKNAVRSLLKVMSSTEPLDEDGLTPIELAFDANYFNEIRDAYEMEDIPCSLERDEVYTGPSNYVYSNEMYYKFRHKGVSVMWLL